MSDHEWMGASVLFILLAFGVFARRLFEPRGWAWWGLRRIAKRPDLRGTWRGVIRSSWVKTVGDSTPAPITAYLVISQTNTTIHVRLFTAESESITLAAALVHEVDGALTLGGIYRNVPRISVRGRSPMHHGGLVLRLPGPTAATMAGQYWTDRKTDGELDFRLLSRDRVSDFISAQSIHAPWIDPVRPGTSPATTPPASAAGARLEASGTGIAQKHFSTESIRELHDAAVACSLDRDTLLGGLDPNLIAQLRSSTAPGAQVLSDLHKLNEMLPLTDGTVPFKSWLSNALQLSSPRSESAIFKKHLTSLEETFTTSG